VLLVIIAIAQKQQWNNRAWHEPRPGYQARAEIVDENIRGMIMQQYGVRSLILNQ